MPSDSTPITKVKASRASEARLDEIRNAAAQAARSSTRSSSHPPQIRGRESYYGLPVVKAPVWTWEVPLYFFIGGIAGLSSCIALAAHLFGNDASLVRTALWIALVGAAVCPIFLITDLGRPARFLNMLRVIKFQSPMSVGAWVLVAFSGCAFVAVLAEELIVRGYANTAIVALGWAGEWAGVLTGLLLAAYTGVLIGATANPVWSHNRKAIPAHFMTSAFGSAGAVLELCGFLIPATKFLGLAAAVIETLLGIYFELGRSPVNAPLHHGKSGIAFRIAGLMAGPATLVLRLTSHAPPVRDAAAICFLCGALLSRYAWIWAGPASAKNPEVLFQIQRKS
ncbi:MAG TPA: NrfD/PsrC family molybdoenzyme membrane anchor subunit [Candidatus Sulfotelmatobacter sp.]